MIMADKNRPKTRKDRSWMQLWRIIAEKGFPELDDHRTISKRGRGFGKLQYMSISEQKKIFSSPFRKNTNETFEKSSRLYRILKE